MLSGLGVLTKLNLLMKISGQRARSHADHSELCQVLSLNGLCKCSFQSRPKQEGLTEDECLEMARQCVENRRLQMERDIFTEATTFSANEKNEGAI